MKCEHCGKNEASFFFHSSVNGKVEETRLCAECAEKLGYTQRFMAHSQAMANHFNSFFGNDGFFDLADGSGDGFFGGSGGLLDSFFPSVPALMGRLLDNPFDDFFTDMPALGAAPAEEAEKKGDGLVEKDEESRFDRWRRLNALKLEMKKAVRREDFERAAELRDQIHAMEQEDRERREHSENSENA